MKSDKAAISAANPVWHKSPWWRDRGVARLGAFKKWAEANKEERERVERRFAETCVGSKVESTNA